MAKIDLIGRKFGRLLVVSEAEKRGKNVHWNCQCECGKLRVVAGSHLRHGDTLSCGCYARDKSLSHGMSRTPEYRAWAQMIQRCENPNNPKFPRYGKRGISVSAEWHDFSNFYAAMGDSNGLTLDRIDNDGNYEDGNCRWTTYAQQNSNYSRNRVFSHDGETLTLTQWASRFGMKPADLYYRVVTLGWVMDQALSTRKRSA